jgi:hypothetical protein
MRGGGRERGGIDGEERTLSRWGGRVVVIPPDER